MSKKIRQMLVCLPVLRLFLFLLRLYSRSFRLTVENEEEWLNYLERGGRVVLCTWHQQFFIMVRYFGKYRSYHPSIMISQSRDGEIGAKLTEIGGWNAVRGSSSRGSLKALKTMIRNLRRSRLAVHIVDGPRGPAGRIKPGVIHLAHAADAVIVPFYVSADRAWYFNSWDRFMLPKPFAKVRLRFDRMLSPASSAAPRTALGSQLKQLERRMLPEFRTEKPGDSGRIS